VSAADQHHVERRLRDAYDAIAADTQSQLPPVAFLRVEQIAVSRFTEAERPRRRRARTGAAAFLTIVLLVAAVVVVDHASSRDERSHGKAAGPVDRLDTLQVTADLPTISGFDNVVGTVIRQTGHRGSRVFRISTGSAAGIARGMPVVVGNGNEEVLVGQVLSASASSALVRRIDDPTFGVGARLLLGNGVQVAAGTASGQRDSSLLRFTPLLAESSGSESLNKGDRVVSLASEGGPFPKDLVIGAITHAVNMTPIMFTVELRPVVDLDALEVVAILKPVSTVAEGQPVSP
jgi:hypothetical protein